MENITLQELHRDILEIKEQLKTIEAWATTEMKTLDIFMNEIDKRVIRMEARATALSFATGGLMGLVGEFIARVLSQ